MNTIKNETNYFSKKGFVKIKLEKNTLKYFLKLKKNIKHKFKKNFKNNSFENFHKSVSFSEINEVRIKMIDFINKEKYLKDSIYKSVQPFLENSLGPDIIVQKNINMGIQMPHDSNRPPFHKDTPHSSNHELVIWIPLVNCYKTMCMHMFDRKFREKAVSLFSSKKKDRFEKFAKIYGSLIDVNFGEAIIFSADNFHNIPINKTNDTRWSINIRFKNLYTPYGERNILDYFEIIKMSCVTKLLN